MAVRKILKDGDEALRRKSRKVEKVDRRILTLLDDMKDTLYEANGAGLAAPQVGILRRVVVIDVGDGPIEFINPEIIAMEGEQIKPEGCLSIPGRWGTVKRPAKVTVRALDRKGKEFELTGEDFLAVALMHETDHLDGILYTDKMIEDVTDEITAEREAEET